MSDSEQNLFDALAGGVFLRLATQLDSLDVILRGVSDSALRRRPADGKWSALEHLAHLGRYHEVFLERVERILAEDAPRLGLYRSEDDPGAEPWFGLPVRKVIERMRGLRAQLALRLANLGPDELLRAGVHPIYGEMPIPLWIEFFLVHEGHHLYTILRLVRANDG
jgi:hypothetical protein